MKLKDLTVERLRLESTKSLPPLPGHERYIHSLVGDGTIVCSDVDYEVTGRTSVFHPPGQGILLRDSEPVLIEPKNAMDLLVVSAPVMADPSEPMLITPKRHEIGYVNHRRTVYEILGGDGPSIRLRVGETVNDRGGWSSWPPHSFDSDPTLASQFEEVFVPFLRPRYGLAMLRRNGLRQDGTFMDDTIALDSGEMVEVPLGEHPIVAGPDTDLMYFWAYLCPVAKQYGRWAEDVGAYQ